MEINDKNKYVFWDLQIDEMPKKFSIESIHDDYEGFRIILRGDSIPEKIIKIGFESVLSYKNTNESYLLKLWEIFPNDLAGKIFYIVKNSSYIESVREQAYNINIGELNHYAIYTISDCVDIISSSPPKIEIL
jgi:hypothetical protein